jgi:integrase
MTRRERGTGSIFLNSKGLWTVVIELPKLGSQRQRKVFRSKDREVAVAKMRAYLKERPHLSRVERVSRPFQQELDEVTVEEWLIEWLESIAAESVRPKTFTGYSSVVHRQIIPAVGHIPLKKVRARDIREMAHAVVKSGLSPTTANQAHRVLSVALTAAQRDELIDTNVAKLVPAPKKARSPQQALTVDERHLVLREAERSELPSLWYAALFTGARQGELLGLRRGYFDGAFIEISWQLQRLSWRHGCNPACGWTRGTNCPERHVPAPADWESERLTGGLWITRPKSRSGWRLVPAAGRFGELLNEHLAADDAPNPHDLVWHMPNGDPIDPGVHSKMWHELLERAGVRQVRFHDARHTAVDMLYEADVPEDLIREMVGHSSFEMTRVYKSRGSRARMLSAMERSAERLGGDSEA